MARGINAEFEGTPSKSLGSPMMMACPEADETEIMPSSKRARVATMKLLTGPATEVRMSSSMGLRKLRGSTGVGLAHPSKGIPEMAATRGRIIVPNKSICRMGFRGKRTSERAAGGGGGGGGGGW